MKSQASVFQTAEKLSVTSRVSVDYHVIIAVERKCKQDGWKMTGWTGGTLLLLFEQFSLNMKLSSQ